MHIPGWLLIFLGVWLTLGIIAVIVVARVARLGPDEADLPVAPMPEPLPETPEPAPVPVAAPSPLAPEAR